ncbi:aldehyde dehydrogenase family protein [Loktanella sp. IMCC34160]|uniref:aldehyde dehydrogenase family protein n=1 Tax=Loktanella sp. IMCC34160 TaxID=2510646 RepID=UPI00101DE742|nr:aldehyde dehydrogenase family protein [Loktanella sp. IMCC34160]RYG90780.1 aldehyde dehydrogenase family protein [Loktanella sp. IMCC34160]
MKDLRKFYINGEWVDPITPNDFPVLNPATEEQIAVISLGSAADVDRAVAAANAAFPAFSQTTKDDRLGLLADIRAAYVARYDEIADAVMQEMGAPRDLSWGAQAAVGKGHLDGVVEALKALKFDSTYLNGDQILREPIGVCGLITPWNWPVNQVVLKVLPALAAGCTMVLKPSELTPWDAMIYAEILHEAGVPAGVFNLVNGEGPEVGAAMSRHPDVQMMSFTGSTRAGTAIIKDAADTVKRVTLELGGKSPNLVFADTDVDEAVARGVRHCFQNTGQSCNAPTRMLVEASVYDRAVEVARETALAQKVGDPTQPGDHIGPLISQMHWDKVQGLIQAGIDEGARLIAGGTGKPDGLNAGYYCRPTVFADVTNDMTIAREEVFGPVLAMLRFETEEEAVRIANDTPYGLAAYVQTGDTARADRLVRALRAGDVHVNDSDISWGSPFGGYKMSGQGREGGLFGIEDFLEIKAVSRA